MKINSINDINKLSSVLGGDETSHIMIQLIDLIEQKKILSNEASEEIFNLIGYLGCGSTLNEQACLKVLAWIKKEYNPYNKNLLDCMSAILANLPCNEAFNFIRDRIINAETEYEKAEFIDMAHEIGIKT